MREIFIGALFCCSSLFFHGTGFAEVEVSTATGQRITFDSATGIAVIEGNAVINNATATMKADKIHLNTQTRVGEAEGNFSLVQSSSTLTGTDATYYWGAGTGTIHGAAGVSSPWHFTADEMVQIGPNLYTLEDGSITSCDEVPPHYRIKSRHGIIRRGKRVKLYNARLVPDDTPTFWLPFYTKSLIPKKYRLRIEPGQSSRDGFITKTILGYPFTQNSWTNFRWDYLQLTGNGGGLEHIYNSPTIKGRFDSYYIRDSNSDKEVPRSKRYTVLWNHYQALTSRLSLNSKVDLKSDRTFGNSFSKVGNSVLVENQTRGLLSEGGLTYQFSKATLQAQFDRQDKFDSLVSSHQFISRLTLPRLIFNTAPLKGRYFPVYTSFNGSFTNDTDVRSDPKRNLRYKRNSIAGVELKRDLKIGKKITLTPVTSYSQSWENRVLGSTYVVTEKDQYVGRYTTGLDIRRRFLRSLETRLGYRYSVRNRLNQTIKDTAADDFGIESNQTLGSLQTRIGRSTLVTLSSGFDHRDDPRSFPGKYLHSTSRILPPALDLQVEVKKNVNVYFRETYSIFDTRTRTVIRTPVNTSGEIQIGNLTDATFFSQGFSYSKKGFGEPSLLFLNNKLKFYLTSKWYVDLFWSYRAEGESRLNYRKLFPSERGIRVARDMHCWLLRGEFSSRPGRTDVSFFLDLKANLNADRNIFTQQQGSVYSTRNDGPDYGQIFPEPKTVIPPDPSSVIKK